MITDMWQRPTRYFLHMSCLIGQKRTLFFIDSHKYNYVSHLLAAGDTACNTVTFLSSACTPCSSDILDRLSCNVSVIWLLNPTMLFILCDNKSISSSILTKSFFICNQRWENVLRILTILQTRHMMSSQNQIHQFLSTLFNYRGWG